MSVVALRGLVRVFGAVRALDGVDLEVPAGQVVALLGHNGAGKTTALRHLTGVLAPTAGTVRVLGRDPLVDGVAVRQRTGVLMARAGVDGALTGRANLRVVADLWGLDPATARARSEALLEELDLTASADERAETYSTGMQQRLALARVLLHEPELLLLDEPTAALDPVGARRVREVVGRLAGEAGRTVVLCTHNLVEAQAVADRVVVLEHGRVVADGSPAALVAGLPGRGLVLEVAVEDRDRAVRVLAEQGPGTAADVRAAGAGPGEVGAAGDVAELRAAGVDRADVPDVLAALVRAGMRLHGARQESASLEDVYLALHHRDGDPPVLGPPVAGSASGSPRDVGGPASARARRAGPLRRRTVAAVMRRDLARVRTSRAVTIPLMVAPLLILVVVPLVLGLLPQVVTDPSATAEVDAFVDRLPAAVLGTLPADPQVRVAAALLQYLVAPLYLVVPLLVAAVIAADSFAGERERGTLELLLHAPTSDRELLAGKVLAAWVPATVVALGGAVVYGTVANLVTGTWLFPNLLWAGLALWVAPAVAALGLGLTVLISSRVRGFAEANQLAGLVVLPVVMLVVGQAAGVLLLSPALVVVIGAVAWVLAAVALGFGARLVDRPRMGARL